MSWLYNFMDHLRREVFEQSSPAAGQFFRFALPDDLSSPKAILEKLDGRPWEKDSESAAEEIRRRIVEHVKTLPYPPSALVLKGEYPAQNCDCVLTICTILSKSSDNVYLARKAPNLGYLQPGRAVHLFVPEARGKRP
ncbi:MAG: hypothetical protein ACUVWX_14560 [Kiritimatiellia bacterium]